MTNNTNSNSQIEDAINKIVDRAFQKFVRVTLCDSFGVEERFGIELAHFKDRNRVIELAHKIKNMNQRVSDVAQRLVDAIPSSILEKTKNDLVERFIDTSSRRSVDQCVRDMVCNVARKHAEQDFESIMKIVEKNSKDSETNR